MKEWAIKNELSEKLTNLGSKPFSIISFGVVGLWYGVVSDHPNMKNTTLFIFMSLSALFLLVKYYQAISPFKNMEPKKYLFSLISIGFLVDYLADAVVWKGLNALGIHSTLNQQLLDKLVKESPKENFQLNIHMSLFAPIGEEILFRAGLLCLIFFILKSFKIDRNKGYLPFIIVSSILFGTTHLFDNWLTIIPYFLSGVFYSVFYIYSKSIIVPIGMHMLNNGLIILSEGKNVNVLLAMTLLTGLVVFVEVIQYSTNKHIVDSKLYVKRRLNSPKRS